MVAPSQAVKIGAGIGALLLLFAITENGTSSNIVMTFSGNVQGIDGDVDAVVNSGIWYTDVVKSQPSALGELLDTFKEGRKDQVKCDGDTNTDCEKSLKSRCQALQTFGVFAVVGAAVSIGGIAKPVIGILGGSLCFIANLVVFAGTAATLNGEAMKNGLQNQDADCGVKGTTFGQGTDTSFSGGGTFGLAIVSCLLCFAQVFFFIQAARTGSYSAV
eukprot:m.434034 g.434034  ORF g.434034 m.434034 type:complete len:217 (+) comp17656_c0_seq1:40-690(+)